MARGSHCSSHHAHWPWRTGKTRLALELAHDHAAHGTSRVISSGLAATRNPAFVAPRSPKRSGCRRPRRSTCPDVLKAGVRRDADVARARQLRARVGRGAARRRSPGHRRCAPSPRDQPRPAPCPRRARRLRRPTRAGMSTSMPRRLPTSRALPRYASSWSAFATCSPAFASRPRTAPSYAICRRLDALPLALELAAPWLKVLTAEDLLRDYPRCAVLVRRPRDSRTPANHERDGRVELPAAPRGRAARVPPSRGIARSLLD